MRDDAAGVVEAGPLIATEDLLQTVPSELFLLTRASDSVRLGSVHDGRQSWGRAAADSAATTGGGAAGAWAFAAGGSVFGPGGTLIRGIVGGVIGQKVVAEISGDEN